MYTPPPPRKVSEDEINELMQKAQEAFWAVVAERFPNCPGDFDPVATHHMDEYMRGLIRLWIHWNVPGNQDEEQRSLPNVTTYKKMLVSIDGVDTPAGLWAYVIQGEYWNGWALPFFTKEQADALTLALNSQPDVSRVEYHPATDEYFAFDYESPHEDPEIYTAEDIEIDGQSIHTYPIGAAAWTWEADPLP